MAYFHSRADKIANAQKFAPFPIINLPPILTFRSAILFEEETHSDVENRERAEMFSDHKVWCMIDMFDVVLPIFMVKSY